MSKQVILVKGVTVQQFDYIRDLIEQGLSEGKERFCVFSPTLEAEIDVIELPDTDEKPYTVHNSYMGMQPTELSQVIIEIIKELKKDE